MFLLDFACTRFTVNVEKCLDITAFSLSPLIGNICTGSISKELYAIYGIWCDENGLTPIRQRSFSDFLMRNLKTYNLEHTNTVTNATGRRVWGYLGIEPLINPRISENWGKSLCTYVPES